MDSATSLDGRAAMFVSIGCGDRAGGAWLLTDPQLAQRRLSQLLPSARRKAPRTAISIVGDEVSEFAKRFRSVRAEVSEGDGPHRAHAGRWPATTGHGRQRCMPSCSCAAADPVAERSSTSSGPASRRPRLRRAGRGAWLLHRRTSGWAGRSRRRKKEISDGLPDAIDLLIVCIESGSGIDQALSRVGDELLIAYPALSAEIELLWPKPAPASLGSTRFAILPIARKSKTSGH